MFEFPVIAARLLIGRVAASGRAELASETCEIEYAGKWLR